MKLNKMNLEQLEIHRQEHISDPKYFLKLIKPQWYYTKLMLINNQIDKLSKSALKNQILNV